MPASDIPIEAVRQILLTDWDPHNVSETPAAHGSYDGYIAPLIDLIRSETDEEAIIQFLREREAETMCFPSLGISRLKPVAKKLLSLGRT